MFSARLDRRALLRSAGVSIALPLLDAMLPVGLRAEQKGAKLRSKRMLLISNPRQACAHAPHFFPGGAGADPLPTAAAVHSTRGLPRFSRASPPARFPATLRHAIRLVHRGTLDQVRLGDGTESFVGSGHSASREGSAHLSLSVAEGRALNRPAGPLCGVARAIDSSFRRSGLAGL